MKNLHSDDMNVTDFIVSVVNVIPDSIKKMISDLLLPNIGRSIIKKETMRAGASPSTVYK